MVFEVSDLVSMLVLLDMFIGMYLHDQLTNGEKTANKKQWVFAWIIGFFGMVFVHLIFALAYSFKTFFNFLLWCLKKLE